MKSRTLGLALVLAIAPSLVSAEPTPAARWLMNEPMSIWDWGIYRLQGRVDNIKDAPSMLRNATWFFGNVQYDWDSNRIMIEIALESSALTSKTCVDSMKQMKFILSNYASDVSKQRDGSISMIGETFSHIGGYQSKSEPKDLAEEIARLVEVEVQLFSKDAQGVFHRKVRCRSGLLESDVSVVQQ